MKFSKKLLAALLPIAATSSLVPVLTSCNKGNGFDIAYGDNLNCFETAPAEGEPAYHSMNDIKNGVKNHAQVEETKPTVESVDELIKFDTEANKQAMYYDFIASNSLINENPFILKWNLSEGKIAFIWQGQYSKLTAWGSSLSYVADKTNPKQVNIKLTDTCYFKSYMYQHTEIQGE